MSYCMSKSALDQFTKCSALDLAPKRIRVNSIQPAAVRTNIFEAYAMTEEHYKQSLRDRETTYPIGRVGEVFDTRNDDLFQVKLPKYCKVYSVFATLPNIYFAQ